jgi:glycosyltransferase involved in cell wall biosynthesis
VATVPGDPPKVSVIVRTKDRPDLLAEAVGSLRAQTFTDFETLVVNDGGPLPEAALEPAPGRALRIVSPEPPGGRVRALNAGLAAARGTFIAYLDDDDLYRPAHLEALVAALEKEGEFGAAFSGVDQIAQRRGPDGLWRDEALLFHYGRPFDADRILFKNDVPLLALLHRRDLVERTGPFDTAFDLFEDWDFLIRLSRVTRFRRVPETTAVYRVRDDRSNATTANPWRGPVAEQMRRALFEKHAALRTPEATMAAVDEFEGAVWLREKELRALRERLDNAEGRLQESGVRLAESESTLAAAEAGLADAGKRLAAAEARLGEAAARFSRLEALFKEERAADARRLEEAMTREAAIVAERDALGGELWKVHHSFWWRLASPWWRLRSLLKR